MTTRPVAVKVSQATRLEGSSVRQASRIASETWSAILSGCPSVTDSEVNKWRFFDKLFSLQAMGVTSGGGLIRTQRPHEMRCFAVRKRLTENARGCNHFGLRCGFRQQAESALRWRAAGVGSAGRHRLKPNLISVIYGMPEAYRDTNPLVVGASLIARLFTVALWFFWIGYGSRGCFYFRGRGLQAVGVEGQGFGLSVVALGWQFGAVEFEIEGADVAGANDDLVLGTDRLLGWGNQDGAG